MMGGRMDERGTWVETCQCGRETRAKNGAWVVSDGKEPCDSPHPHYQDGEPPSVPTELGWCGCGEPERVDEMMLAYLQSRVGEDYPKPDPVGVSPDAVPLLAYMADALGWTEHGGSVGGAWLTDNGYVAIGNLTKNLQPV